MNICWVNIINWNKVEVWTRKQSQFNKRIRCIILFSTTQNIMDHLWLTDVFYHQLYTQQIQITQILIGQKL